MASTITLLALTDTADLSRPLLPLPVPPAVCDVEPLPQEAHAAGEVAEGAVAALTGQARVGGDGAVAEGGKRGAEHRWGARNS